MGVICASHIHSLLINGTEMPDLSLLLQECSFFKTPKGSTPFGFKNPGNAMIRLRPSLYARTLLCSISRY